MKNPRILMIIGALLPLALFFFPMWIITLEAPQYPDAIGMDIWINKIEDHNPNDIKNINLLNHYVGMKAIPTEMKEFEVFPWVIAGMSGLGLLIGFIGRRKLYLTWFILMSVLGSIGMYDFYAWEYDYGHDLDEKAAIKIPGQGYQPPVIGTKMILNFKASSWPSTGAYFLFGGMMLSLGAFYMDRQMQNKEGGEDESFAERKPDFGFTSVGL